MMIILSKRQATKKEVMETIKREYTKCLKDPMYFFKKYVKIQNPIKGTVPFELYPFQEEADAMFNSALIYELSALKNYALPQLKEISNKSPYYSEAKRLCTLLSYFEAIDSKDIPSNSLLREFIGGSIFE